MSTSHFSAEDQAKIVNLFENMNDSRGNDSDKLTKDWLKSHNNHFSGFINNEFLPKLEDADVVQLANFSESYATVTTASEEIIRKADESSAKGLEVWKSNKQHSHFLHKIAQSLEKNADLFAQVESLSSGKHLYRTKNKDVPNLIQSFYYYSSMARDTHFFDTLTKFSGVVVVVAEEFNNPILSVSWRVASVLVTGSVVSLLVDAKSCASAFLLAELCSLAGLPAGVLNVLPIDQSSIKTFPSADKLYFTGESSRSKKYIEMAVESCAKSLPQSEQKFSPCKVLLSQRPVVIVYESADLHSASNGVLETLFFNDTRTNKSGCSVYVQTSIKEKFHALLEEKFAKITVGKNFSKTDMSCIVTREQHDKLKQYIKEAQKQDIKIFEGVDIKDETYIHWNPTLICDVSTTSKLFDEVVEGPIVITTPFRTVKESIAMFNHKRLGTDVSIWSEKLPLALEVAEHLRTRTIWINTQNLFDASISYGGLSRSGNLIEGGRDAFLRHVDPFSFIVKSAMDMQDYGTENSSDIILKNNPNIKLSYELHIGGSYKKPSGGSYRIINDFESKPYAYIGEGSSADIQSAVSCASAAQEKWQKLGKYKRMNVLEKAVDSLKAKKKQFLSLLKELTGPSNENAVREMDATISTFHFWSNLSDYWDGSFMETKACGKVLQERNPLGVIGIQIAKDEEAPLWYFASTVIPAIAYGNAVVVVGSGSFMIPCLQLCEILQASGLPGGTVNVVTGACCNLTRHLALNMNIDAIWHCDKEGDLFIQNSCITHPKNVFRPDVKRLKFDHFYETKIITESTYLKNIFMPVGDIFAN